MSVLVLIHATAWSRAAHQEPSAFYLGGIAGMGRWDGRPASLVACQRLDIDDPQPLEPEFDPRNRRLCRVGAAVTPTQRI
jgi:hypothetical protein